jgi:tetratricopeptide (TPR) repeat protein
MSIHGGWMGRVVVATLLSTGAALAAGRARGQTAGASSAPARPPLEEDADTNDPAAYYVYGVGRLRQHPREAAAAFYWAARLEPTSPHAFYARRAALLMSDPWLLERYLSGDERAVRSAQARSLDSLQLHAMMLDPFFTRRHDDVLAETYLHVLMERAVRSEGETLNEAAFRFWVERYLHDAPAGDRAWILNAEQRYRQAVDDWALALRRDPKNSHVRAERARALFALGAIDSARAELTAAIATARQADTSKVWYVYESKAEWEFSVGWASEQLGELPAAREAYQRALVEDLSYYPAHLRLGAMALTAGDTAAALVEMERAAQVKEDDYLVQLSYGVVLDAAGRYDSAGAHFRRAAELEPYAPMPQFLLARSLDALGDAAAAAAAYERCAGLSKRDDPSGAAARQRAATLRARGPDARMPR